MLNGSKLFKWITNDPELKNIPIIYITKVAKSIIKAINSGECWEVDDV